MTEIYGSTFSDCSSLRSITIPETVTSIWDTAFYSCSSLTSITIPESVVSIGENVFNSCYSLTKINIPTKTRGEISGEPWGANNAIVYWKDTKVVDDYIVDITKGEIVKYIGTKVNLTVPSSFNIDGKECKINSIFNSAFFGNKNIKNVNIQQGITSIGSFAFDGCSSLTSISIPEGMTRIGDFAFHDCKSLTEVTIPKGVTSIGDQAFTGCSSIASITIPESVVSIGNLTFQNCSSLRSITLSEGLKSIGEQAFRSCSSLTSITIPESMTSIGYEAFIYCYSLKKINIPTKTRGEISGEPWDADNAIVYWKDTKIVDDFVVDITKGEIVKYIGTKVDLTVPSSFNIDGKECKINSIFESAFSRNKNIKNVNIQQGITSIGRGAFNSCSSLTSITIPESVTSIGDFAFQHCSSLRSITIPGAVTEIRGGTFFGCKSLTSITMPGSTTRINTSAFQDCSSLASITIPESVTYIGMCAFQNCSSLASITIPEGVTNILSNAFGGCTSLRKINIPKGTDIIPNDAFKDSGIETIYVDQNRSDSRIVGNQPWGASNTTKVFYKGEFVSIDMTSEKVKGEYARNIKIEAYIDKKKLVSKIVMPDGKIINVGNPTWTGEFKVTKNGTYIFKGYDDSGNESEKVVTIDDIGKPIVSAENATIDYEPKKISKAELYKLLNASAIDELDVDVPVTVTDADLEKVKKIKNGETVEVTVKATHPKFNLSDSKKVSVTLNLPNVIPGSQDKPEGYVTVTFAKGEHGKLEGETSQHVNPAQVTDLKAVAPKVKADIGFKHTGWDKELKAKFEKDTTITATYEEVPDIVPGSQEKPAGYVTVTFAKGEHGNLSGELSQHVNPTKVTDLKAVAPKVKADIGFKHIGWDKELKAKFEKDTTITATYEALPNIIPGSQDKPEGYVTVTFAKGEHGKLEGETSQHVNPAQVTDLKAVAPKVKADVGFKFKAWDKELKAKFEKDTTITATYEALPNVIQGSKDKPEGYVTVTFAKGEHGKLEGETSQHVNPTQITDLKTLAPKVKADIGFKHIGWDKELKAKFEKDTTVTATYEALPNVIPGSQDKPEGYVTVTFAKGDHGSLSGELSQHVNPTQITDLKAVAPKVKANIGFKHIGWDKELKAKFEKDTTVTATYEALPNVIPGSQDKPEGYVTVTFAKGEHGKLEGETSQHVNPTKVTDLKTLVPKVKADIGFKHIGWDKELKAKFDKDTTVTATYKALPDVIPGSQDKPEGYVTVTFAKGEHGSLSGETSQHVNPTKVVDLKTLAPKVTADTGFKHTGWDKELKAKFDKDTTVTATYEALPDTVPGSQEKPAGYVTVTFAKGEHGKLSGETSQHVNPTKVVDLKTLAPKVTADTGFKHTGWDKALKAKFDKDTTVTATYEALPDTVHGSQEKPAGYVTVTFAKGEHGSLSGEMSQHVNPTKVTDLKTLAPKVTADTGFKHTGWNGELKKKFTEDTTITATYEALPDVIPGSQEKPAGYVTVTFAKGEHGKLSGETSQHVNPTKVVDLKTLAPKVTADTGFKHTGWSSELKKKFTEDTTITATYEALPDTVPGSQEKPAGYVTVTFAKGEHGKLEGELSQHVNPTKVTDLKTLAPKVTADTGFKHTGWNSELKKKFTEDTTITATYEALPDTVPGSQEKPEGYVTVTFAKGEHGKLEGELSQHVNPTKITDLKSVAPKVKADIGFKHTGWNSELKKKFTEDTTITATYEVATEKFAITIDPDGGNWNGSTDPIVYNAKIGEYITLPDAPTKEGYTFKYWKGSKYMPGDRYKVEGEHKFTAVWEKKDTSKTDDSSTGTTGTSGTAGANGANTNKTSTSNHAPFTADSQNIMLYLMMSIFSFVLILRLRSQEN